MKQTILKEYIRDAETNNPRGVAVAIRENDEVFYGFSLQNVKLDRYDKQHGINIAIARAKAPSYQLPKVEERLELVLNAFESLEERAVKYFKDLDPEKVRIAEGDIESSYVETE